MNPPAKKRQFTSVFDQPQPATREPDIEEMMSAVDRVVDEQNIPTNVFPKDVKAKQAKEAELSNVTPLATKRARKVNPAPTERFTVELPAYVVKEIKQKTVTEDATVRYLVIKAFKDAGYTVNNVDLFKDGRRGN